MDVTHAFRDVRSVVGVILSLTLLFIVSGCAILAPNELNSYELSEYGSELIFAYLHQPSGLEGIVNRWGEPTMILTEPLGGDSVEFMSGNQERYAHPNQRYRTPSGVHIDHWHDASAITHQRVQNQTRLMVRRFRRAVGLVVMSR